MINDDFEYISDWILVDQRSPSGFLGPKGSSPDEDDGFPSDWDDCASICSSEGGKVPFPPCTDYDLFCLAEVLDTSSDENEDGFVVPQGRDFEEDDLGNEQFEFYPKENSALEDSRAFSPEEDVMSPARLESTNRKPSLLPSTLPDDPFTQRYTKLFEEIDNMVYTRKHDVFGCRLRKVAKRRYKKSHRMRSIIY